MKRTSKLEAWWFFGPPARIAMYVLLARKRLKELVLALLVALVCRYGKTEEQFYGHIEKTTWGPLQFTVCATDGDPSLTFHKGKTVRFLLPA